MHGPINIRFAINIFVKFIDMLNPITIFRNVMNPLVAGRVTSRKKWNLKKRV